MTAMSQFKAFNPQWSGTPGVTFIFDFIAAEFEDNISSDDNISVDFIFNWQDVFDVDEVGFVTSDDGSR